MQLRALEFARKALPDGDRDVFSRWNLLRELGNFFVEEAVVHGVENLAVHDLLQLFEIDHESGVRIDYAFDRNFEQVIMAMTVWVTAFAENAQVLFRSELRIAVVVRCGELRFAR